MKVRAHDSVPFGRWVGETRSSEGRAYRKLLWEIDQAEIALRDLHRRAKSLRAEAYRTWSSLGKPGAGPGPAAIAKSEAP